MALNPNHTFEDLGEVKCSIVEKNCSPERVDFLKRLLEHNGFVVVVLKSPPPKAKPAPPKPAATPAADGTVPEAVVQPPTVEAPPPPDTFTVGITDLTFSPVNGVLNRELKTFDGEVVTVAYWKQQRDAPLADEWYWKK